MKASKISSMIIVLCLGTLFRPPQRMTADEPKVSAPATLTVIDSTGKEQKLKTWQFVSGTRRLSWLASPAPAKEEKDKNADAQAPAGPEALEFREENSTNFAKGIFTLIPLDHLRAIDFDNDKQTVTVRVAGAKGDEELTGMTKFQGENKLVIEAEVDKGDLGVAEVKYLGGVPKGIRGLQFPAPKPLLALSAGRPAQVTATDKEMSMFKVTDLQPLYRLADGSLHILPTLMFKKTLKLDLGKIQKIRAAGDKPGEGSEYEVTLKDGEENTLTLLKTIPVEDKPATLEGLVGRVPAGYKLFPIHTIAEVQFEESRADTKP